MKFKTFIEKLPETLARPDRLLVERAYAFAQRAHSGQTRASGAPYIEHSLAVADILATLGLPASALAAALLHDVVEDSATSVTELKKQFGAEVAALVDGVTKLTKQVQRVEQSGSAGDRPGEAVRDPERMSTDQAETIRKTFLAMGDDVRVVLIKLADRLHNMRTLSFLPVGKQRRIAQETLDIFAPLANRLGIWQVKWELEDLGFRYVEPKRYKEIATAINRRRAEREKRIAAIVARLQKELRDHGIDAEVTGRPKHIHSIWRKMRRKDVPFEQVYDIRAVRVLVKYREEAVPQDSKTSERREKQAVADCYLTLGLVHQLWSPIPGEFDDYVATPKDNFYQSLHTVVVDDDGDTLEVQIRTETMHEGAEYGIAAHWRYKEGGRKEDKSFDRRIEWLRSMMDWRQDVTDGQEFVDALKSDLFPDRVFAFTPRGDIIDLPAGATPVDFAYHIHTAVGERCRGAKVNGRLVSLNHALESGDQVEILTSKRGGPSRDWLNADFGYVRSARAREKIRSWLKKQARKENISTGRSIIDREVKRLNIRGLSLEATAEMFGHAKVEDFLAAVGCGDVHGQTVINRMVAWLRSHSKEDAETLPPADTKPARQIQADEVNVYGTRGLLTHLGRCCNPVPGDEIVGYTTRGRGVTIHRKDCPNLLRVREAERLISVVWGAKPAKIYPVSVRIVAFDREGLMRDISTIVADEHVNMSAVSMLPGQGYEVDFNVTLEVSHLTQLSKVLSRVEQLTNVTQVRRLQPG